MSETSDPGETPFTEVSESDPNADSADGLGGGMGVSSERKGPVRGQAEEVTYAAAPTHTDDPADAEGDLPPEQSAFSRDPEVNPDPVEAKPFDSDRNPRHGV